MNKADLVLHINGISKVFNEGKPNEILVIDNLSIDVEGGEFISLIGPSGCGKSTLLRLIGGLTPISSGELVVNGKSPKQARLDRDYGMAFQTSGLLDWRTAVKNIELPLELMGWDRTKRKERAEEMLSLVQLEEFAGSHPRELSGGMQQRIAIARALSFRPRLLLMDEPFGALDEMTREHMQNELINIYKQTKTTIVFVTHSIPEAVFLSSRVIVLCPRPGKITKIVGVDLGEHKPELREDNRFFDHIKEVREILHSQGSL